MRAIYLKRVKVSCLHAFVNCSRNVPLIAERVIDLIE
jgi:hypothetical protein